METISKLKATSCNLRLCSSFHAVLRPRTDSSLGKNQMALQILGGPGIEKSPGQIRPVLAVANPWMLDTF